MPARSRKAGAQKWVIQRVRKVAGVVAARLVGEPVMAAEWKKSRTWSSAMRIITAPRRRSIDWRRCWAVGKRLAFDVLAKDVAVVLPGDVALMTGLLAFGIERVGFGAFVEIGVAPSVSGGVALSVFDHDGGQDAAAFFAGAFLTDFELEHLFGNDRPVGIGSGAEAFHG